MDVTLQNCLDQINDLNSNYNFSNIDPGNKIRATNRAIEYVQRRLGLPSDKKTFPITFVEGTTRYTGPTAFNELIKIYYDPTGLTSDPNIPENKWYIYTEDKLLSEGGIVQNKNRAAVSFTNGILELILLGKNLTLATSDNLLASYWSSLKGTDSTGTTSKIFLDQPSDICAFGAVAPDLIYPISLKAATILNPQLQADKDFQSSYKQDFEDVLRVMGRSYPRIRAANSSQTILDR